MDNIEMALKYYDLAILNDAENGENFFKRGVFLYEIDKSEAAMDDFDYSIKLNNSMPAPYTNRGLLKLENNDKDGACLDWKRAFQLGSEYAQELIKEHCK